MAVSNQIVKGDYVGHRLAMIGFGEKTLKLYDGPGVFSKEVMPYVGRNIESIEQVTSTTKTAGLGETMMTEFLFGTARAMGESQQAQHTVAIKWKDGKKSLAEVDGEIYSELVKLAF